MGKRPDNFIGLDLTSPSNRVPGGRVLMAANVRAYGPGQVEMRTELSSPIVLDSSAIILDSSVQSLVRMNDTTPAGPADGFVFISVDAATQFLSFRSVRTHQFSHGPTSSTVRWV